MSKIQINKKTSIVIAILGILFILGTNGAFTPTPPEKANAGEIDQKAVIESQQSSLAEEKKKLETQVKIKEIENQKLELEKQKIDLENTISKVEVEEAIHITEVKPAEIIPEKPKEVSSIPARNFKLNSGKLITGQAILDMVKGNPNGLKLWQAFNDKFGTEVADTAAISLYYENGTLKTDSIGVCTAKYMIGGDYRNCNYADMNSAGLDVGLKQINTFYQAKRITKLGGEACSFGDSRDRNDPCNQKKLAWLLNVDNNIKIAIDIYQEQGNFDAWYGYKRAFNK
jgi:hypothetical protein